MQSDLTTRPPSGLSAYRSRISAVWQHKDFRWYWLSSSVQGLALGTQFMVIGWLVLEITESSAQLGLVVLLYGAPNVSLLLVAGVIADRFDRRYILMLTQAVVAVVLVVLAFLTVAGLAAIWHVYTAAVLMGAVQSISMPARMTMIGDLVERQSVLDAVALQGAAVHAGRIAGPPLAGLIIEVWGVGASLFVIAGCYAVGVAFVGKIGRIRRSLPAAAQSAIRNCVDGLVYVKNNPIILTVIIITCAFGGFGMSHLQVIPAMAKDALGTGATGVGLLFLASGLGSLIGSLLVPIISRANVYRALLICLALFTVALSLFAWSNWFWTSWVLFVLVGIVGLGMVWPLATTMVQTESSPEVRGRVMGILQFTPGFHLVGAYPLALAAGLFGWEVAITGAAGLSLAATVWFALVRRGAPRLNRQGAEAVGADC